MTGYASQRCIQPEGRMTPGSKVSPKMFAVLMCACLPALAQTRAIQAQSPSSVNYSTAPDGTKSIEIQNVAYEVTNSPIPGRKREERFVLRKTVHSKEVVGDIGIDAKVTVEAWPLGADLRQKPV